MAVIFEFRMNFDTKIPTLKYIDIVEKRNFVSTHPVLYEFVFM